MNSCEFYQELISRMVDGELSAEEQAVLAPHLENCPECAALAEAFKSISGVIAGDMAEPPEALTENVMAELRRAEVSAKNRKKIRWKGPLATAACLTVIVAATWLLPNMFRAGSAAPAEMPAAASDQAAPQTREYAETAEEAEENTVAAAGTATETGAAPKEAEPESAASAEYAEAYSMDDGAMEGLEEDFSAQAYSARSSGISGGEYILLEDDSAAYFSALLSGSEAQLPDREADAVYTIGYSIEGAQYSVQLCFFGGQVYYSSDGALFYLSTFSKSEFDALISPKKP